MKKDMFRKFAARVSVTTGSPLIFVLAVAIVIIWGFTGPLFHYSDTWQLVINTGTTIVTFLMVFLIQNTQNRDSKAVQLKLDELIRATKGARTHIIELESLSDADIAELDKEFQALSKRPGAIRAINKLHEHIEAERVRRTSFGHIALHSPSSKERPKS